jgi:hypothetical protein
LNKSRGNFYVKHIFVGIIKGVLWEKLGKSWGKVGKLVGIVGKIAGILRENVGKVVRGECGKSCEGGM